MEPKTIDIPFDYKKYADSQKVVWKFSNKKFIKSQATYTILATSVFILTITINSKDNPLINAFITGCFFYFLMGWMGFIERRIKFYNAIKKNEQNVLLQAGCRFTFSDFGIEYEDKEKAYKLSWILFRPFLIYKEHLLLIQKSAKSVTFIFNKN